MRRGCARALWPNYRSSERLTFGRRLSLTDLLPRFPAKSSPTRKSSSHPTSSRSCPEEHEARPLPKYGRRPRLTQSGRTAAGTRRDRSGRRERASPTLTGSRFRLSRPRGGSSLPRVSWDASTKQHAHHGRAAHARQYAIRATLPAGQGMGCDSRRATKARRCEHRAPFTCSAANAAQLRGVALYREHTRKELWTDFHALFLQA